MNNGFSEIICAGFSSDPEGFFLIEQTVNVLQTLIFQLLLTGI